jgi:putative chitinase
MGLKHEFKSFPKGAAQMNLSLGDTKLIIEYAKEQGLLRNQLAYVLATAYHESAHTMKPIKEAFWIPNAEAWRKKNLRYYPWYGRGYVQITWEDNYLDAEKKLGVPFTKDPDLVMIPENAVKILVRGMIEGWFTKGKYHLIDFITLKKSDFVGARKLVNGTDKKDLIATYARDYDIDLKKIGYGEE